MCSSDLQALRGVAMPAVWMLQDSSQFNRAQESQLRQRSLPEILAHDAEIRELTSPWLKQLERFLAGSSRGRRLGDTYRSEFG